MSFYVVWMFCNRDEEQMEMEEQVARNETEVAYFGTLMSFNLFIFSAHFTKISFSLELNLWT